MKSNLCSLLKKVFSIWLNGLNQLNTNLARLEDHLKPTKNLTNGLRS